MFLPVQLGKHLWPPSAFVQGLRIDYLSPTLYVLDLLILLFLLSFTPLLSRDTAIRFVGKHHRMLIALLVMLVGGTFFAENKIAVLYGTLRIIEFILFGIAATYVLKREGSLMLLRVAGAGIVGLFVASAVGIYHVAFQQSIGGLVYFLGERTFSSETPGIANASINGVLTLRPYSTFPHPNVFGWYGLVVSFLSVAAIVSIRALPRRLSAKLFLGVGVLLGTGMVLLSMSRAVAGYGSLVLLILPYVLFRKSLKQLVIAYIALAVCLVGLLAYSGVGQRTQDFQKSEEAVVVRQALSTSAVSMVFSSPLVGVGVYNFIPSLPRHYPANEGKIILQPVHSIYLLVLAEGGVIGFILLLLLFRHVTRALFRIPDPPARTVLSMLFGGICVVGFFDHHLLTLEQSQILFVIALSVIFAAGDKQKVVLKKLVKKQVRK